MSPARTCIATRLVRPPEHLIRFVVGPEGSIVPDIARKLPGRGLWVTCHRSAVAQAVKSKAFARHARRKVVVADDLLDRVDVLLQRRVLELLSLCNKAGLVVSGAGKVNTWLEAGANGALVQARDASPDGLAKVTRKYQAICAATQRRPEEVPWLTIDELSLAIGRENVVHAAVSEGAAAANFLAAVVRVANYRAVEFEAPALMVADSAGIDAPDAIRNTGQV